MVHIHDEICEENGDFRLAVKWVELENTPLNEVTRCRNTVCSVSSIVPGSTSSEGSIQHMIF